MIAISESHITISSNRIYVDELAEGIKNRLNFTRSVYSRAKEKLYNVKFDRQFRNDVSVSNDTRYIKNWLKDKFNVAPQDYYITSLQSHANGMISSQKELVNIRKAEFEDKVKARKKKLKTLRRKLTMLKNQKKNLIDDSLQYKESKIHNLKAPPKEFEKHLAADSLSNGKAIYDYELWVDSEIKAVQARINQIEERGRTEAVKIAKPTSRVTFGGGKGFYKLKDTTDMSPESLQIWHEQRNFKRSSIILFSGRFNAKYKNWLVKYNSAAETMDITLIDSTVITLTGVRFPYRGNELINVLNHPKQAGYSVGYWMEFRKDHLGREFILMKASFQVHAEIHADTANGVIGADLNLDNISWSETDSQGHLLHCGQIRFDTIGKSTNQSKDILGRACSQLVYLCKSKKKPLILENLDLTSKSASLAYGKKKANYGTRMFAYSKMDTLLSGKTQQENVLLVKVNPAYTSFFGKTKYMKRMHQPVHVAASYVIARRGMGFNESVPKYLKNIVPDNKKRRNTWSQAYVLKKTVDKANIRIFRKHLPVFSNAKEFQKICC